MSMLHELRNEMIEGTYGCVWLEYLRPAIVLPRMNVVSSFSGMRSLNEICI